MTTTLGSGGSKTDRAALDHAVETFFAAFTSGAGCHARIDALRRLLLPQAVVVRTCGHEPVVYGVEVLVPREEMLTDGTLQEFHEWPLHGRIDVFGDIAQWSGAYAKTGTQSGQPLSGRGVKIIQFVRTGSGWRISAAAWDDERPGHALPE